MSNYSKTTNFAAKDALISGDVNKIVKGTELDTEFNNIQTASATKADTASPTFTGTVTAAALAVTGASTVVDGSFNILGSADATKKVKFEVDGLTTATTRTVTVPDRDITLNALTSITASLGADVNLNNTANYFDGPSVAQGTVGTWYVSGTVTVHDGVGAASFTAKLWDGTTVIASCVVRSPASNAQEIISLSGVITSPAGNLRISVKDTATTSGFIDFNGTALGKDSTITAIRIA